MLDFHERERQVLQHQRFLAQTPKACHPFAFSNFQRRSPTGIFSLAASYWKVLQISCGLHHAVLLADGGLAFAWGFGLKRIQESVEFY
jgi:alpha-tubulin suppressor-like RCC1 family protein